jgi:hypothetical protein
MTHERMGLALDSRSRSSNRDVRWPAARIAVTLSSGRPESAAFLGADKWPQTTRMSCADRIVRRLADNDQVGASAALSREPVNRGRRSLRRRRTSCPACRAIGRDATEETAGLGSPHIGLFASPVPRLKSLPSCSVRRNGSLVQPPPTGTVFICESKAKQGPGPSSIRSTTFARPSATGRTSVAKPMASNSDARSAAASASRPGGFCASMATSCSRGRVGGRHRARARDSQGSLHFPSRRDFIEGFDSSLPGGVDSVV